MKQKTWVWIDGAGEIEEQGGVRVCKKCGGTGKANDEWECNQCGGSGYDE